LAISTYFGFFVAILLSNQARASSRIVRQMNMLKPLLLLAEKCLRMSALSMTMFAGLALGLAGFLAHHAVKMRQASPTLRLDPEIGKDAVGIGGPGALGGGNVGFLKAVADADVHGSSLR
jgi:hypothetical protein